MFPFAKSCSVRRKRNINISAEEKSKELRVFSTLAPEAAQAISIEFPTTFCVRIAFDVESLRREKLALLPGESLSPMYCGLMGLKIVFIVERRNSH
jgi:hypothetical protein